MSATIDDLLSQPYHIFVSDMLLMINVVFIRSFNFCRVINLQGGPKTA